jgi:Heparinase II/III-like protein/Alginate lyase
MGASGGSPVLTSEELTKRRAQVAAAPDLSALLRRLVERAGPVLERMPIVPSQKALLTADGGMCSEDGSRLEFDPWRPTSHRCPTCGREYTGERHDRAWAHYQHLWVAERAAHLSTVAVFAGRTDAAERANQVLQAYEAYSEYPNQDNVLGPSRLFFSTYLESIWIADYLAAATLLREDGQLQERTAEVVSAVADEAANIIGEFDEGLSNRQTWHNAALAAIAVWFEDEALASRAIESSSGVAAHLVHGFGEDGMWYEGDNYHLFALRGQLLAMRWARQAGVDLLADARLADRLSSALRAPTLTALPDFTFPARKDSRFGVSLAQPMYLELWEIGLARLQGTEQRSSDLWAWLELLYKCEAPSPQTFDSYLHEAGEPRIAAHRGRRDLSWWALLEMEPELPAEIPAWAPESSFIEGQGLAVLREGDRYLSLECGSYGGGHGHPDRLNLVLHAAGEYWLPDFGTGSYVSRDLFWYRSTLAHNAPRLDGASQSPGNAVCDNFDRNGQWAWVRGRYRDVARTVIAGPRYLLDIVELTATDDHLLELPWHLSGSVELLGEESWVPDAVDSEFVREVARLVRPHDVPLQLRSFSGGGSLTVHIASAGDLLRAVAPGAPGTPPAPFYLMRARGRTVRFVTLLEPARTAPIVLAVRVDGTAISVETGAGVEVHHPTVEGWEIRTGDNHVRLAGSRRVETPYQPIVMTDRPMVIRGMAVQIAEQPAMDGTLDGFDASDPLLLDHEDQYRRSEEPYPGPEEFSASALVNWTDDGLYLGVDVVKADVRPRDPNAPPLRLDNEVDEIHADGIQVYLRLPPDDLYGLVLVPSSEGGQVIARDVSGMEGLQELVRGSWQPTEAGYTLSVVINPPGWDQLRRHEEIGFDLLVNQSLPGRLRRAGQLVWSGGGGWVWLRGDRQDPARYGILELS